MKQFLAYMIMTLAALWTVGCSDDSLSDDPTDQPERGIVIRLSTGDLETRTDLTSQANLQHVTEVYAVLYEGTGDEAAFVSVEKLDWNPSAGGNGFQKKEFTLPKTATDGLSAGSYTILCVGLDDKSGATYGLTLENINNESNGWKTLADAKAALATGKSTDDIAHSELFAGWAEFEFEPDNINIVEVEMKRRVAGGLCYVTDIPTTINTGGVNEPVKKLRLALYTGEKPNNQISLCRKEVEKATDGTIKIPDDFGENNPNPNAAQLTPNSEGYLILKEIDLEHLYNSDGSQTGEIFVIPEIKTDALKVEANSLLLGAYVIPIAATDEKVTLKVELLGEKDQVLATFNAKRDGTSESESYYNIYPNYIYHIGDKPESDSTEGDQPASLLGKELTVVPQEWTTMPEVDVDFPSVPVKPRMELDYGENYIFDCVPHTIKLTVINSILDSPWILQIDASQEGVYFKNGEIWKSKYEATPADLLEESVDIDVLISDYAELNAKDVRQVKINLISDYATVASHLIQQYNAIIFSMEDGDKNTVYRGFSHFDYGTERNRQTGEIISNEGYYQWGYDCNRSHLYIYNSDADDYNGETNLNNAKKEANSDSEKMQYFLSSAMHLVEKPCYSISGEEASENTHEWYLPAFYELEAFFDYSIKQGKRESWNIVQNNKYWTSCILRDTYKYAYAFYIDSNNKVKYGNWWDNERTDSYRLRQACIVNP
mgnify:CR=1 FL=1